MDSFNNTYICIGIFTLIAVIGAITKKPLFLYSSRYTKESLDRFSRPAGIVSAVTGLCTLGCLYSFHLFFTEGKIWGIFSLILLIIVIVLLVVYSRMVKKILVKNN